MAYSSSTHPEIKTVQKWKTTVLSCKESFLERSLMLAACMGQISGWAPEPVPLELLQVRIIHRPKRFTVDTAPQSAYPQTSAVLARTLRAHGYLHRLRVQGPR